MLYCQKCSRISPDGSAKCENCKSGNRMREVSGGDYVYLHRVDQYTAQILTAQFDEENICYRLEANSGSMFKHVYDSEVMPTDQNIFVTYECLPKAKELSARLKESMQEQGEETFEDMPAKRRLAVQIISVALFLLLISATVLLSDAVANWLRSLVERMWG